MTSVSSRALAVVLLVAGCSAPPAVDWRARDRDPHNPELAGFAPELRSAWTERVIRVDDEIAHLSDHPWAGIYRTGDGFDRIWTLRIAPESGFTWEWAGCGGVTDLNVGTVREEGGALHLTCEWPNVHDPWKSGCPETLSVVARNGYLYLVQDWEHFRSQVERGWDPLAMVLVRVDDDARPISGSR